MEGITFKVEPLKRTGEDATTMRARLLCSFLPPISIYHDKELQAYKPRTLY
jgi:hypothetical protein